MMRNNYTSLLIWLSFLLCPPLLLAQTPTLTNGAPIESFIGEEFCFPITIDNVGNPGYGPYVRLVLPPEFTFNSATFAGGGQVVQNLGTITNPAPLNFVIDPITGANNTEEPEDTIFAPVGSTVIILEYPVGSMVQGGVTLESEICVFIEPTATLDVPVNVCVEGVYEFGNSPTGVNGPIAAGAVCAPVTPILYLFDKSSNEVENPGACHTYPYILNVDIAAGGALTGPIIFSDTLPDELQYVALTNLPPGCVANIEPSTSSPGGILEVECTGNYPGSLSGNDMQVIYDGYIIDTLDESICDITTIVNSANLQVPNNPDVGDFVTTEVFHVLTGHSNNVVGSAAIGQTVTYTIQFDITEYTAGLDQAGITFIVADGMVFDPNSVTWGGTPVPIANMTIVPGPGTGSTVTIDVHAENGGDILPCVSPELVYRAEVNQTYGNGDPVLSRDTLRHFHTLTYDLVEGATNCTTSASSPIAVQDVIFQKTVINTPPNPNGLWWPGDTIQYLLELSIPSLDLDDVTITDFFPLPIHDVTTINPVFGAGNDIFYSPTSAWTNPPISVNVNAAANSLAVFFGDVSDGGTGASVDIAIIVNVAVTDDPFADGLFHSNFMQVNSDNSTSDNITNSQLTLIQVGAPDLEIVKGVSDINNPNASISPIVTPPDGNGNDVDANDSLTFTITVTNTGAAPGYDLQVRDVAPPELTGCMLIATDPVTDGAGNPVAFTGGFSGNALILNITDSIGYTAIGTGNDVVSISYVCEVVADIQAGVEFDNTAEVDWASATGATNFPPEQDDATTTVAQPSLTKAIDYIFPGYDGSTSRATIGEVIAYELQVIIPEGTMQNAMLIDRLDEGLAFVSVDSIVSCMSSGAANIISDLGSFSTIASSATFSDLGTNPEQIDREMTIDFGNLQNFDTDNINDTIKIYYQTIVINHITNTEGEQVNNRADFEWTDPNNTSNTISIRETAPNVTIIEPQVNVIKTFTPDEVLPGNNAFVTITVQNPPTSSSPAFDVSLTDILPAGMFFVSGFSQGGTANVTNAPTQAGGTITAHWDTIGVGEVYSMTFEVQASSAITPCFTLTNCANVVWESIAEADEPLMPTAFSSPLGIQRTGNQGGLGGVANTYTRDSCADLDVVIDNTFDPFITANTPICEGDRATLTVQQYNGNVVTYNWFGPGVPNGFNNYELIIDPVTPADTGTYYVIVELDGCITDTSNFFPLSLRPEAPAPNITPNDTLVCEGATVVFSTDSIASSYIWSGPNGFTGTSATPPIISPVTLADAGTYTLITTNSFGCSSDPVSSVLSVLPQAPAPAITNNSPICTGDTLVLSSASGAVNYQWIAPNGADTITTSGVLNIPSTDPLYIAGGWTLITEDANGCTSEPSLLSNVVINATPQTPFLTNNGPICEGENAILSATTLPNAIYEWYSDPNLTTLVAVGQSPTITGLIEGNSPYTFYAQIISDAGCVSDTASTVVIVGANPALPVPSFTPLCAGDSLFLFSNSGANSYNWTGPNGFVSNISDPVIANASAINAGSYTLEVSDINGCSSSGIVQVAIEEQAVTPVINFTPFLCEGDNIELTTQSYTGNNVIYTWGTPSGNITTGVPSLIVPNTTPAESGTYSVFVTVDGCESLPDSVIVTINANPAAPLIAPDTTVCEGGSISLYTTSTAASYDWSGPNGFTSSSPNPTTIVPASLADGGTYTLNITDINGCQSPDTTLEVIINPAPNTPALTGTQVICDGDDLILTTSDIANSYMWIAPNGDDTTTVTGNVTIPSTSTLYQNGNWSLVVEDANGCTSANAPTITVNINTVPPTAVAANSGPVCIGDNTQLSTATVAGATYEWYSDAGLTNLISNQQNPTVTNITADSTFFLVVTVNSCSSPATSTTVTVHPAPTAPTVPNDTTLCEGGTITMTTSTVANSYMWSGPNGFSSTQQNPAVITPATLDNAGTYTLMVEDANGCQSPAASFTATVNPAPAAPVLSATNIICLGDTLILSTTAIANNYVWTAPNGTVTTTTTDSLIILSGTALYQAGSWSLVVEDANGCASPSSNLANIVINIPPPIFPASNNGPVCLDDAVNLSVNGFPGATYEWYSDAGLTNLISTQQNPTITNIVSDSTFYAVTTLDGCSSVATTTTVTLHPVPAAPLVPADTAICEGETITVSTSTIANSYMWSGPNGFSSTQQNPTVIDPATLADAGTYTLSIEDANGCQSPDASFVVTVNPAPTAPVLSNNSAICDGDDLILSTTDIANSYIWTAPNGLDTVTTTPTLTITAANTAYYQSGDWTLSTQSGVGCPSLASAPSTVVINSATATPVAFNNGSVCIGGSVELSTAAAANATYEWYSDAGLTNLVGTGAVITINNITTDSTFFVVVTTSGCTSLTGQTTVSVITQPGAPDIVIDTLVCDGGDITFSTSTVANSYMWSGPNGFSSTLQNPSAITNASVLNSGTYTLLVTFANGCTSTDTSLDVTVNPPPPVPPIVSNGPLCFGDTLFLSSSSGCGQSQWIGPNGNSSTTLGTPGGNNVLWTIGSNTAIPPTDPNYLAGTWYMVCIDTLTGCSTESASINVEINAVPSTPLVSNNGPVCTGATVQLNTSTVSNATYEWYSDAGLTNLVSNQQNPFINNITTDSTFYLVVTVNGCSSPAGATIVNVIPQPAAPAIPADFAVCEGQDITLGTTTVANAYFWTGPNGFTSNLRFPLVIQQALPIDAGTYTLYVIDGNGCQSADTSVNVTVNPNPVEPTITANAPLCFGDTLFLGSSSDCGQSQWIGPNGNSPGTLGMPGGTNVLWTIGSSTAIPSIDANYLSGDWYMICIDTITGCTAESNTINVEIKPEPQVSAFNNGPICNGEEVDLTATFVANADYYWYSDASLTTLVSTTQIHTISNLDTTTTFYLVIEENGCTSPTDSTTVIVNQNPLVPNPSFGPVCTLDSLFLFTNATAASYWWEGPNGFQSNLENPVIANIQSYNAGSYVVTITDSLGCEAVGVVEVDIYPKPPTPTITHNAPVCEGEDITLYTQPYFGLVVDYVWTLPNGTTDTTQIPSLVLDDVTQADTGAYSLVVIVDGCISLPAEEIIRIHPTPATPDIPADFAVCEGSPIVLTTTTSAEGYFWTGPNGFQSNLPSPTVVSATAVDTGLYSLYVTNIFGCRSGDTSVHVDVNPLPAVPTITSNAPLCFGDTLILTSSSDCGQSQWIGPNGNSAGTLGTPGGTNVLWTIGSTTMIPSTDPNYLGGNWHMICIDTITGCQSQSPDIMVDITPIPATPAAFNDSPVCVDGEVELSTATVPNATYAWYADSTLNTLIATSSNPTITGITQDTVFYLTITVNGCTSLAGSTNVTVHPISPAPDVPADFAVCESQDITLMTTTVASDYFWTGPNGFNSNLQNPAVVSATLADAGTYNLFYIDTNGCPSLDTNTIVTVNPNPAMPVLSSNSAICDGDDLVLSTTASAVSYVWIAPDGATDTTTTDSNFISDASTFYQDGDWTLQIIDANGCVSPASDPAENVVINGIPSTQAIFNNSPICEGSDVNLTTSLISGATYAWYADATLTTLVAVGQNPTISDIISDTTFHLAITINGCTGYAGSTFVQTHPSPPAPDVPADFAVCEGGNIILSTSTNASGYFWTGSNGFSSNLQTPQVISPVSAIDSGAYSLFVIDNNGCISPDTTVNISVNPTPLVATVVNTSPACEGDDVILTANGGSIGATFDWYNNETGLLVGNGQTLTLTSVDKTDEGAYYVISFLNGCQSDPSGMTPVEIDTIPSLNAFAGLDIDLCDVYNVDLDATNPLFGTAGWTTNGSATIVNNGLNNTAVYNLAVGNNVFYWTLSNGACPDYSTDSVIVDVTGPTSDIAFAGLDIIDCGTNTVNLAATTPTLSSGVWMQSAAQASSGVSIANPTDPNTAVSGLVEGNSYTFDWVLSFGNCEAHSIDQVNVTIDVAPPDNAYAGVDITQCNTNTAMLDAFASSFGDGFWTTTSSATIVDPTDPNSPIVNLPADTSVFYWTLSNGTCSDYSMDSVFVVISTANEVAEAGINQVDCGTTSATLNATAPANGFGTWSQSSGQAAQGVVIIDINDPNTQVLGLVAGNTYSFNWTLTNGTCLDYSTDITTVTITSNPTDNAFAGADINLCGSNSTQLEAIAPSVGTGMWTSTSTATIVDPTDPTTTIVNLPIGSSTFYWTLSSGSCLNYDQDSVVVNVTAPNGETADAGLDSAYCSQNTINLAGNTPITGGGFWSQTASQASLGVIINDPADPNTLVTGLQAGLTYVFDWTLTDGGCVDYDTDEVIITVDILPIDVAYAGEDTILCGANNLELDATMPPIGTGLWTTNSTSTIVDPGLAGTEVVNIAQDTTVYYWTLSNGACMDYSTDSMMVVLSSTSGDVANAGFDETLCVEDSIQLGAGALSASTGLWTQTSAQSSQGITIVDPTNPNTMVQGIQPGQTYEFEWTISTPGCPDYDSDEVVFTINAVPLESAYAGPDIVLCNDNTTVMAANTPSQGTGLWSSASGATIINPTLPNSGVVNLPGGTHEFYWSLSNSSCTDFSIDTILITVAPTDIDVADAGLDIAVCDTSFVELSALLPTIADGVWSQDPNQASQGVTIIDSDSSFTGISGLQANNTYTFTWSLSSGPCVDYDIDDVQVIVSALPSDNAYGGDDLVFCSTDALFLNATPPTLGTGMWTTTSGAVIVTPSEPMTEVLNLDDGSNAFIWSLSNGACVDYSVDTLFVTVDDPTFANDDYFVIDYNSVTDPILVTTNDTLTPNWTIDLVTQPTDAEVTNVGDGTFTLYTTNILSTQEFTYVICNANCPDIFCDTAVVTVEINGGLECNVPNIITPNNDGINDALIVPCLENYPNSSIYVFNRWGDKLYESDNYQNDWQGTFNGQPVPDGAYFYILTIDENTTIQGFVEVRR